MYGLAVKQQSVDEVFEKLSREDDGDTMKLYLWSGIHLLRYFCSLLSKDSVQNCALTVTTARLLRTDIAMALRLTMLRTTEFLQEVEGSFAKFEMPILTGQVTDEHEDKLRAVSIVIGDVNQVIRMRALEAAILCEDVVHDFADIFASEDSRIDLMMRMKFHMVTFRHTILRVFGIPLAATNPATQLGYLNGLQCCLLSCWDLAARLQDSGGVEEHRGEVVVSRQLLENRELLIWLEILESAETGDDCTVFQNLACWKCAGESLRDLAQRVQKGCAQEELEGGKVVYLKRVDISSGIPRAYWASHQF
ncbi:hypothetical protein LTR64_008185 [Lithohypha guttulata]|uniref:uncharacterized protein n=1 Tax=Lithohypha guttulata TaxID=1690604 RepID=UPI002DE1C84E|nr:hypothetical protein LTR51_008337 [Lithohypha guttulata]